MSEATRCGYIAILGRPNVGKSTLLNQLLHQKISITSRKPQTTRHRIVGVLTEAHVQMLFVDTPGIHRLSKRAINRYMNRVAEQVMSDVDLILFMIEGTIWRDEDAWILEKLSRQDKPVILVINKVDLIKDKAQLLPQINMLSKKYAFADLVPISAEDNENVEALIKLIPQYMPEGLHLYPEEAVTDRNERFMASEIIREKLTRFLGDEVPHAVTVSIEEFKQKEKLLHIAAIIWVERPGQKGIVIGKAGSQLKTISTQARLDLEKHFKQKVFLNVWVKVKGDWTDSERSLSDLGYR